MAVKLAWNPSPEKRDKIISISHDADLKNRDQWPEYIQWLIEMVKKFRKTFMPRVRKLKLDKEPSAIEMKEKTE